MSAPVGADAPVVPPPCVDGEAAGHGPWQPRFAGVVERCRRCGLTRTARAPTYDYGAGYFSGDAAGGYDFDGAFARALDEARFGAELRALEREGLRGSVLDVGCATGSFLRVARARGWAPTGVEPAAAARTRAAGQGFPVHADLDELPAERRFDLVTLHHVLEHVHEPLAFLSGAVRPRVGRRLLVEVPNVASLAARVHGPRWRDLRPEQHVWHFEAESLRRLLEAAGFVPLRVATLWEPLWTLRTAADLLALLPGLLREVPHAPAAPEERAGVRSVDDWRPPRGLRRALVATSRVALRPLVRSLERRGLGERLVAVAEPAGEGRA